MHQYLFAYIFLGTTFNTIATETHKDTSATTDDFPILKYLLYHY